MPSFEKKYCFASVNQNIGPSVELTIFQTLFAGQTSNLGHKTSVPNQWFRNSLRLFIHVQYQGTGSCIKLNRLVLSVVQYFKFGMKVTPKEQMNHSILRSRVKLIQPCVVCSIIGLEIPSIFRAKSMFPKFDVGYISSMVF